MHKLLNHTEYTQFMVKCKKVNKQVRTRFSALLHCKILPPFPNITDRKYQCLKNGPSDDTSANLYQRAKIFSLTLLKKIGRVHCLVYQLRCNQSPKWVKMGKKRQNWRLPYTDFILYLVLWITLIFRVLGSQKKWVGSIQISPITPAPTNPKHPLPEWYVCYNQWTYTDTSSPKTHSLH